MNVLRLSMKLSKEKVQSLFTVSQANREGLLFENLLLFSFHYNI